MEYCFINNRSSVANVLIKLYLAVVWNGMIYLSAEFSYLPSEIKWGKLIQNSTLRWWFFFSLFFIGEPLHVDSHFMIFSENREISYGLKKQKNIEVEKKIHIVRLNVWQRLLIVLARSTYLLWILKKPVFKSVWLLRIFILWYYCHGFILIGLGY